MSKKFASVIIEYFKKNTENDGVALNVARTRVTILVFNLTIISFLFSMLMTTTSPFSNLNNLNISIALYVSFCLTLLGIFWLLLSQNFDEQGLSQYFPFTLGCITTYLALSQTITAFMHLYLLNFTLGINALQHIPRPLVNIEVLSSLPLLILISMGGVIWGLITYVAPLLAMLKSPFRGRMRIFIVVYYFSLQIPIYWVYSKAWSVVYIPEGQSENMIILFLLQFIQPLLWFR